MSLLQAGPWRLFVLALLSALLAGSVAVTAEHRPVSLAVFDFELFDVNPEGDAGGVKPAERKRLRLISDLLRRQLESSGSFVLVDTGPEAANIKAAGHLYGCNGCEAGIARSLGADFAITGTVKKVSNLILIINLYVRDAATGNMIRAFSVDVRGNNDKSWSRGVSYIVRNKLLPR